MAWTTPRTWVVGETLTAALMNTHVKDNLTFLGSPPQCQVSQTGQTLATSGSLQVLTATTETYDNDGMHSTSVNTSRITANTAGRYWFSATIGFAASATGMRQGVFYKNNVLVVGGFLGAPTPGGAVGTVFSFAQPITLAVSDYVEVQARQDSGGSLGADLYDFSCFLISV